jgi:EAL domain-containing protein (putative c-di-GMP-specific phosphodiesterase class I)
VPHEGPALTDHVASIFGDRHQNTERITLEITKGALMEDPVETVAALNHLHNLGVTLTLNLSSLKQDELSGAEPAE